MCDRNENEKKTCELPLLLLLRRHGYMVNICLLNHNIYQQQQQQQKSGTNQWKSIIIGIKQEKKEKKDV